MSEVQVIGKRADRACVLIVCAGIALLLLSSLMSTSDAGESPAFRWGAVGHSDRISFGPNYSYNRVPISSQIQLLTLSGLTWYRTSCVSSNCSELIAAANAHGINILKQIGGQPDPTLAEAANYSRAYSVGLAEGTNMNSAFSYFEAGNELDNWVGMTGDGSTRGQYNAQRYPAARGFVRGLIDGVHAANSSARVMVDDAGWCHYGFLQMLWEDGVRWDVTAFHWYSDEGNFEHAGCENGANVASIHAQFGLPIWITEFNSKAAAKNNDPVGEANWISAFMNQVYSVAPEYGIQGAFVYELLDEPTLSGMESHFGIFDGNGLQKLASKVMSSVLNSFAKPVSTPKPPGNPQVQ